MWSEQTWLLIVPTWIAVIVVGIIVAIAEQHRKKK